jgi:hypothetical protein
MKYWLYCSLMGPVLGLSSLFVSDVAVLRVYAVGMSLFFGASAAVHAFIAYEDGR